MTLLLLALLPPGFFILHTLFGLLLMIPYGVRSWKLTTRGLHVVARRTIAFRPAAQTHGFVVFFQYTPFASNERLIRHEFKHVQQSLLFGAFYPVTYILWFLVAYTLVVFGLDWWEREPHDDDVWHAYRTIPWERWAVHASATR